MFLSPKRYYFCKDRSEIFTHSFIHSENDAERNEKNISNSLKEFCCKVEQSKKVILG